LSKEIVLVARQRGGRNGVQGGVLNTLGLHWHSKLPHPDSLVICSRTVQQRCREIRLNNQKQ
jgi:hypothetical protein